MTDIIPFPVPAPASADARKLVQPTAPAIAGGNPAEPKTRFDNKPYLSSEDKQQLLDTSPDLLSHADQEARIQVLLSRMSDTLTRAQRKEQQRIILERLRLSKPRQESSPHVQAVAHYAVA